MNAKTGRENASRGAELDAFRGPEPKLGEAVETAAPPVDDDAGGVDRAAAGDLPVTTNQDQPKRQDDDQERSEPRPPPSEEARAKISARFRQNRDNPPEDLDGQGGDDPAKAKTQDDETEKPRPDGGVSDSGADDNNKAEPAAKPMTLTVLGKTVSKSLDEVAALAELSVEEVRENPARAIKYAQRELATQSRLSEANEFRRSAKPAPVAGDDTGERPDPNKDRKQPVRDDDSGQPNADRKTTGPIDWKKLAEDIQIEDPETVGKKLEETFNTVAAEKADKVKKDINQDDTNKRVHADKTSSYKAVADFVSEPEHRHVAEDEYTAHAMSVALTKEYKADLEAALEAEGDPEALEFLRTKATPNQIADAHQARRINGDPRVRRIDKEFVAKAYQRLPEGLRGKIDPNQQKPSQGLAEERRERKANLTPQPRRASSPPAQPAPKKEPMTRQSAVARMREGRGQGGKPVSV